VASLRAGALRVTLVEQLLTMARRGRGVHFLFGVADVDEFYEQLSARALDVAPPADEGWGGRFITVEDPDRYRLCVVTWHDAGAGRAAGGGGSRFAGSLDDFSAN
jgi:hypothetical protein